MKPSKSLKPKKCKICKKVFQPYNSSQVTCGEVECWAANEELRKKNQIKLVRRYKKFNDSLKKGNTK